MPYFPLSLNYKGGFGGEGTFTMYAETEAERIKWGMWLNNAIIENNEAQRRKAIFCPGVLEFSSNQQSQSPGHNNQILHTSPFGRCRPLLR